MEKPLNLAILHTVESFGSIPRKFLYRKLQASSVEIDRQIEDLEKRGAIQVDDDMIEIVKGSPQRVR